MAGKGGPPHTLFQKGHAGGPGRPKGLLTKPEVQRRMSRFARMTVEELNAVLLNPFTPALDLMIVRLAINAIAGGERSDIDFLLERTIGKVRDEINLKTDNTEALEERREFARAMMLDPETRAAASILASKVAHQKALTIKANARAPEPDEEPDEGEVFDAEIMGGDDGS